MTTLNTGKFVPGDYVTWVMKDHERFSESWPVLLTEDMYNPLQWEDGRISHRWQIGKDSAGVFAQGNLKLAEAAASNVQSVGTRPKRTDYEQYAQNEILSVYSSAQHISFTLGTDDDDAVIDFRMTKDTAVKLINDLMERVVWLDNNGK